MELIKTYFNPFPKTPQIADDSNESVILGFGGVALMATAVIGYRFFKTDPQTIAILGVSGMGLFLSHLTGMRGYAFLVGAMGASGIAYQVIDTIKNNRLQVEVNVDIIQIIKAASKLSKTFTS